MKASEPYVFEASWEVCNKVGGIHTVLESKAELIKAQYGDGYFLVGPYLSGISENQFEEGKTPAHLEKVEKQLAAEGIKLHFGYWLIDANPQAILIEFTVEMAYINKTKSELWDWYNVDSLGAGFDFDEPVAWSWAVGKLILAVRKELSGRQILLQCHEWMAGAAILYLERMTSGVSTIFTTHATFLGRSMTYNNIDFYKNIKAIDANQMAKQLGIVPKHSMEKAITLNCTVATTVSDITAMEMEHFYGRKPDIVLPNGLNFEKFPNTEEATFKHIEYKKILKEFLMCYFFPHYTFNLDKTLIYFLCGRYEVRAKGMDLFIDALGDLNRKLKSENHDKTIVAFFAVPGATKGIKPDLVQSKGIYANIKQLLDWEMPNVYNRLLRAAAGEFEISGQSIFKKDLREKANYKLKAFKRRGNPSVCSHSLQFENDQILSKFADQKLLNLPEDRVKVVLLPVYLDGTDGLLNINIYDFMSGCHLGVLPSAYEPWGYTPLEAGAMSVASITTDLSGFGLAVDNLGSRKKFPGIYVLSKTKFNYSKEIKDLSGLLYKYSNFDKDERMISRIHSNQLARNFDWKVLVRNYFDAHELALKNTKIKVKA
ncbi:hypothetical protein AUK11_04245 [bacterium CG2_30_37_16]|nr:MAG: hypothetical protein AUK11_04245 [bacterium CG2_30_37_16]PIP30200.1 MAG: hypothetical protein COX25_05875 [bacterium (Candidatus Howlettbacteria) CG23_combo_of_CG06-09_8_20_14_all_37_9]PIX99228.1 MAG: hypothetical protein COZ22_03105 [bacterium (Candidatus Howlettbacteria) CG_4_10_14_3_um_filter_37_10]PJB05094.1 MAG: hypothetical protein CO123_04680 [bacterium (Candidatus Howlettbacteria) CG_4_9_14_3_um_filter_37_10]